ncbi:amino acid adenylation domain-containing protein [Streptomyces ovatisporus]|uniref:Amino acid adenylation domain-containing protein n=1 Tax=Streptomyces ovatisporus TaxID=1128682 RepID=A0ABV9ACZ2_9ACTN
MSEETVHTSGRTPLGAAQRGIWYAQRLDPGNPLHSGAAYLDIRGALDTGLLAAAVRRAVSDTEALKLAFTDAGPDGDPGEGPGQYLDAGTCPEVLLPDGAADEESALRWMHEDLAAGTDPLHGPLSAQALFPVGEDRHLWYYRAHHLLLDGMGLWLFQRRADAVLSALRSGSPVPGDPAAPLELLWQEEAAYRASERYAADRAYWQQQMHDRPTPPLSLAGPAAVASHSFLRSAGTLPAAPADALDDLAARHDSGRPAALVAAVTALVHRITGATDIVLGLAVSSRLTAASRRTPSMHANVVPLRLSVHPGLTVDELVGRAALALRGALRHQRYPQEELRRDLGAVGARRPLFGPTVNLMRAPHPTFGGLPARLNFLSNGAVDDLKFTCYDAGSGALPVDLDANPDRYTADELDGHRTRFLQLLTEFADDPGRPLARIDVRTPAERRSHRPEPATPADAPAGGATPAAATLTELFERQAARTPDRTAVTADDESLTYGRLDRQANRLARLLAARGAGPGRLVALALPRTAALPVALLAVLKTGAAYLPLDPGYPAERIAMMVDDARPAVLLTDAATAAGPLPEGPERIVLGSPAVRDALAALPETPLTLSDRTAPRPEDTAYVIYTSGSTGRPKGVLIPHRNVVRLFSTARPVIGFGPDDVWTLLHSYAFDFSVWEIWGPLLHGGRLVVVPQDTVRTPARLLRLLARERVTVLSQTPSALQQLIRTDAELPAEGAELTLRRIVLGGEALDPGMLRDWYARHPDDSPLVVNMYGITETTVHVTHRPVDRNTADTATGSPIGRPLSDLGLYLLDSALRPCVPGTPGELYVSGAGLAHGYLGRAALTAERFVADPFGPPGSRMYRTGDLARYNAEGELEHLGRADGQVQLRGFRIETAEIDAELTRLPEVSAAATVLRGSSDADRRLVSYVVPAAGAQAETAGLRARLADRLPPQSVPAAFVLVPELPLTPNGKLDRDALPEPSLRGAGRRSRGPVEERLCALFEEVLGCGAVGADDDFFELGGHSLIATRLVSRVRAAFGAELGVGAVFDAPTPADLAARIVREGAGPLPEPPASGLSVATREVPPDAAGPDDGSPLRGPLSAAQRRMWTMHRFQGPSATYNLPCAVRLTGALDRDALREAVQDLVRRHDILRTRYPEAAGEPVQEVTAPDAAGPVEVRSHTTTDARLAADLTGAARVPFEIESELPLRVHLFTLPDGQDGRARHALLLVLHHIAGDGWSLGPLLRDLGEAYAARAEGRAPHWGRPAPRHIEHATHDHAAVPDPELLEFWRRTLDGAPEQLPLPTDRQRSAVAGTDGGSVPMEIDAELHERMHELARQHHATVFMVLHAALAALLTASGAGTDVVIGTPTSGRGGRELDDAVGFFVNPVALRVDTGGRPAFSELLDRVRRADLDAYDHQDVPFDRVVDAVAPQRSLARHPLFQVVLSFQDFEPRLALPGLDTRTEPVHLGAAKFDLTLNLVERRGEGGGPAGIAGDVEYATDLFDEATASALADRLLLVLRAVCAAPGRPVADLDLVSERERRAARTTWNPVPEPPAHPHLPALFGALAGARPDAPALEADGETLDYAALDARTSRLARLLIARGVRPGTVVPLVLPRSGAMATAWLAVLKAGAAAMPVDPDYPVERIRRLLDAAAADTPVPTLAAHTASLPSAAHRCLVLDAPEIVRERDGLPAAPVTDAERGGPIDPRGPAYVIHTSGSTGRPKGVVVPHTGLPALAAAQAERFALDENSRVLQFASPSFDASVMEYLMAYGTGATLVVPPPGPLAGEELAQVLDEDRISHALIPPTALTGVPPQSLPGLRTLVVGGEACPPALAAQWSAGRRLVNAYGPTETTCCATTSAPLEADGQVPIGTPVAGLRVHVLDDALRLAPAGVPGELYIAGPGVGHGYLGRPGATAERFVADPYGPPGSRAFRTGDRARRRFDGTLEYLGRADDQVKIRGFRIEPGEISAALGTHPAVRRCAVVVREDRPGDRRLVAYVVPADTADEPVPAELRRHVAALLPAHMVPSAFVALAELPVTRQGKLDREALPAPDHLAVTAATSRAPRSGTEATVCGVFADALGIAAAGPDDDFFELGGDSIIAIQLVSRLRGHGLAVTTRDVFECRTAAALTGRAAAAGAPAPEPARPVVDGGPFPAPPMAHWLSTLGPSADAFSQTMTVRTPPVARPDALRQALQHVVDSHAALRTTLLRGDPDAPAAERLRLTTAPRGTPDAAELLRRVETDGAVREEVRDAELARARAELAPEEGRMVRAVWFDAGDRDGRLALVVHHLAVDAVSWGVLLPGLRAAYEAAAAGTPLAAPPPAHPCAAWATGLAEEATQPERVRELPLWSAMLADRHVTFGTRPPDPERDTHSSLNHLTTELSAHHSRALLTEVPTAFHCRILEPLLTAFGLTLAHWGGEHGGGQGDVLLDLEGHGRDGAAPELELDSAVGWFTTVHPLRLPLGATDTAEALAGGPALGHAVKQVKEALRAIPGHGRGYGLLRHLNDRTAPVLENLGTPPVAFNYLGRFRRDDAPWSAAPDDRDLAGAGAAPGMPVGHALEVNAVMLDGTDGPRLRAVWSWPRELADPAAATALTELWTRALTALVDHVQHSDAGGWTPSDLPLVDLGQSDIEALEAAWRDR